MDSLHVPLERQAQLFLMVKEKEYVFSVVDIVQNAFLFKFQFTGFAWFMFLYVFVSIKFGYCCMLVHWILACLYVCLIFFHEGKKEGNLISGGKWLGRSYEICMDDNCALPQLATEEKYNLKNFGQSVKSLGARRRVNEIKQCIIGHFFESTYKQRQGENTHRYTTDQCTVDSVQGSSSMWLKKDTRNSTQPSGCVTQIGQSEVHVVYLQRDGESMKRSEFWNYWHGYNCKKSGLWSGCVGKCTPRWFRHGKGQVRL